MPLKIPGYRIIKPIAEGGMAAVYLAEQQSLGRRVVLNGWLLRAVDRRLAPATYDLEGGEGA